jgi:hypothetical protein
MIIPVELTYYSDRAYHMPDLRSHSKSSGEVVHVALGDALKQRKAQFVVPPLGGSVRR